MRAAAVTLAAGIAFASAGCGGGTGTAPPTIPPARVYRVVGFQPSGPVTTGKPVTVAATPISRLDALEDSLRRDGAVPSMNFNRPASTTPRPPSSGVSHHGHSHGPGTGHHSH